MVHRIYVEKRAAFAQEAASRLADVQNVLGISGVTGLRILNRYDVEGVDGTLFSSCRYTVFAEPQTDETYGEMPGGADAVFAVEYLPGQYDQRADACAQCMALLSEKEAPLVRTALSDADVAYAIESECAVSICDVLERRARSNLFASGNYEYRFKIVDNLGRAAYSAWTAFTTADTIPVATPLSPDSSLEDGTQAITFRWTHSNESGSARGYTNRPESSVCSALAWISVPFMGPTVVKWES